MIGSSSRIELLDLNTHFVDGTVKRLVIISLLVPILCLFVYFKGNVAELYITCSVFSTAYQYLKTYGNVTRTLLLELCRL